MRKERTVPTTKDADAIYELGQSAKKWGIAKGKSVPIREIRDAVENETGKRFSLPTIRRYIQSHGAAKYKQKHKERRERQAVAPGPVKSYGDTLFTQYAEKQTLDDQVATALDNVRTTLERVEVVLGTIAKVYNASQS